jgi:hypothetical protein
MRVLAKKVIAIGILTAASLLPFQMSEAFWGGGPWWGYGWGGWGGPGWGGYRYYPGWGGYRGPYGGGWWGPLWGVPWGAPWGAPVTSAPIVIIPITTPEQAPSPPSAAESSPASTQTPAPEAAAGEK